VDRPQGIGSSCPRLNAVVTVDVPSMASFLERAVRWFAEVGVRTERVLTDNGSCYLSRNFKRSCEDLGVDHKRTRPYRPRTNGKAERFIQTSLEGMGLRKALPLLERQATGSEVPATLLQQRQAPREPRPFAPMTRVCGSG